MHSRESWLESLARELQARRDGHLFRELRELQTASGPEGVMQGENYLQFASNNYLGLATHPAVIAAAREATERFGTGSGASRLVTGSMALHHELEEALARFKHAQAALLFPTGYMANLAVLTTFAGKHDGIVSDKLNHASLLDAARHSGAAHRTFPHRQYPRAEELLSRMHPEPSSPPGEPHRQFLVTDAVFSMDGDVADLPALAGIAQRRGALLVIDDAHGTGVLGARGAGLAELQNVEERIDLTVGTLSKALASIGGFVAGPRVAIETLINHARSFIFTTALPPACAAAALAALKIVGTDAARRVRLHSMAEHVRGELRGMGFDCGDSTTPIIPVILRDAARTLEASALLQSRGIYVPAIRPPTVAPGTARLRISLMATHSDAHIERLLAGLREVRGTLA